MKPLPLLLTALLLAATLTLAARSAPAPSPQTPTGDALGTFVPSEEVPADVGVSFPVDI